MRTPYLALRPNPAAGEKTAIATSLQAGSLGETPGTTHRLVGQSTYKRPQPVTAGGRDRRRLLSSCAGITRMSPNRVSHLTQVV